MNWTVPDIFIHATDLVSVDKAQQLAANLGLPIAQALPSGWRLLVSDNGLQLARPDGVSVRVDFINGKANRRASEATFKKQPLARALGLNKIRANTTDGKGVEGSIPTIIDATAGFGIDAWMMASLGCSVTMLEQSPILHALLEDALAMALNEERANATAQHLRLINTNAIDYLLDDSSVGADIVYLDPMYPSARKHALVKKGMQLLHELIGADDNGPALLQAALKKATHRIVVKRPKGAQLLTGSDDWSGQITSVASQNTRYDIYHIAKKR